MEGTPVTESHKRDRRQAVLNSQLMKELMETSDEEESDQDDLEEERPKKRAYRGQKQSRRGGEGEKESTAKTKRPSKNAAAKFDIGTSSLIEIIKNKPKFVGEAALKWLERYEANPVDGLNELLLTMFEACGVTLDLDEESYMELDVDDVVKEMLSKAKQGLMEDYLGAKKDGRMFKENLLSFWDTLVCESQEGALFDQQLMEKVMDYVIALSCTPPRIFRNVATLIGLQLVTSFVSVAKTLGQSRETAQRQLNAEKKKRKEGARIESLNKQLSEKHEKITMVEEMMRKIFTGLFMHRYRDVDSEIRQACISAMGSWIVSYPSLFLQDLYLKYIGWTLNDKNPEVRNSSIGALQALYEVDDHVPSLSLFSARFSNRMVEMADDVDLTVAVNSIGLLKQLLKHQLLNDDELGSLFDLLIDEAPQIRLAVGDLVYDHLIAQSSEGEDDEDLTGQLERVLRILREFCADPILCDYVIDALWDKCSAMKDWKCMITMLLEDTTSKELNEEDTTILVRVLLASVKKAVGEKIVPSTEQRKSNFLPKAQKEAQENRKREMTLAMVKSHAKLLRKYLADNAKVSAIIEIGMYMQLELYSLKRQEQNFISVLQLIKDAFFKHGDENILKTCIKVLSFATNESQGDLQDSANQVIKETADDLLVKLRSAITQAGESEDDYSLTVNLRRLYQLQLAVNISDNHLFTDLQGILNDYSNLEDEVIRLVLSNMFLHLAWGLKSIDLDNPDDNLVKEVLTKRDKLMEQLQSILNSLLDSWQQDDARNILTCTMCAILSDLWSLFSQAKLEGTKLQALSYCPSKQLLEQFWKLCEYRLSAPDGSEEEIPEEPQAVEYMNEKDAVVSCAAKLIAHDLVPKDHLGPALLSHFILHGKIVEETVKQLLTQVKKYSKLEDLSHIYLDAMKRAYERHIEDVAGSDEDVTRSESYVACKELGDRLAGTFFGFQRKEFRPSILGIVKGGIDFALNNAPKRVSFLEVGVLQFAQKLSAADIKDIVTNVEKQVEEMDVDADPSSWQPYFSFVEALREKIARAEPIEKESGRPPRPGRKKRDLKGKKLFENPETSSDEESPPSESEDAAEEDDDEDDNTPLFHVRQSTRKKRAPAPAAKVSQIDSTQATPAEITLSAEALEEEAFEEQTFRRGPLSPDDPLMTGSATEEQLPVMEFGGLNARTTAISGESDKETEEAHDPYSTADAPPVRNKRPVSFSSDDEDQSVGKKARHE
ncbi:hypothetical protein KC19_7G062600 [Ceratodon purpureus]|uniref:Cohesin subunit SA-3 n=1 Tax=Ceratodon purpureus TaxID=3225 RepID=A0A8T0H6M4_CERPU|nr:hypothetical protein KC19_7G062600 [Ceratodon purpureus]KAG0566424.1 hypothetical protein KC19_7G062600 [Ceratodon purpureus]KAG0566425.1 hypothetical protein KC19_7G062600 [Ceratodon purpureus]